jgi:putative ABC transport system permease protein
VLIELMSQMNREVGWVLVQAGGAAVLCLAVVQLCRGFSVRIERETITALLRGFVQIALVGLILAGLLKGNALIGGMILLFMAVAAAVIASRRAEEIKDALWLSFYAIAAGSGVVICGMVALGAIQADIAVLVPVGSMIIASAMSSCSQSIERFRADVTAHVGHIEAGLALGADPAVAVAPFVRSAVYASLVPRLDSIKSLGIVWVPGMMAGMIVSGANPIYAGIYQFIVMAMIFAASCITALGITLLLRRRVFSAADQLTLRPATPPTSAARGDNPRPAR